MKTLNKVPELAIVMVGDDAGANSYAAALQRVAL